MNGLKLGTKEKQKNSFAFQNEFLNYQSSKDEDSEDKQQQQQQDEYEQSSQSRVASSKNISSANVKISAPNNNNNNKLPQQRIQQQQVEKNMKPELKKEKAKEKEEIKKQQKKEIKKIEVDQKLDNINKDISKLNVSIMEMKDNYDTLQVEQMALKKRNQRRQSQIKQFLEKKKLQKQDIIQRKRKQQQKQRKKLQEEIRQQQQNKASKSRNKIEEHLRRLNQRRQRREAEKQKADQQSKLASQLFQKLNSQQRSDKKFHLRKLQEDDLKKKEEAERRKQILAQRKLVYKSIDISQLSDHERRHEEILQQKIRAKQAKREQQYNRIEEENCKFQQRYKGHSHEYVQDEIEERKMKMNAPKQKYKKLKEYQKHIRQHYLPKTHQPSARKSLSINQSRSSLSNREVRKYRYRNGVAMGSIVQGKIVPMNQIQLRQIGNENLAYLRSLPKKKVVIEQPQLSPQDLAILDKKLNYIVKVKKQRNPLYEKSTHKSTQVKISKNPTRDEVNMIFQQLKSKDEHTKMKQKLIKYQEHNAGDLSYRHKQINNQIVKNIQQKLSLLAKL